jgi:hypothetical protein
MKLYKFKNIQFGKGLFINEPIDIQREFYRQFPNWEEIPNQGSRNCGIFINKAEPHKIIKCGDGLYNDEIKKINDEYHLFAYNYEQKIINGFSFLIMERFQGDLNDFFIKECSLIVCKKLGISENIAHLLTRLLKFNSEQGGQVPSDWKNAHNIVRELNSTKITFDLFKKFLIELNELQQQMKPIVNNEIIKLFMKLYELELSYGDIKYDNVGYILSDKIIEKDDDFRNIKPCKFFDKYLYVYLIDLETFNYEKKENVTMEAHNLRDLLFEWDDISKFDKLLKSKCNNPEINGYQIISEFVKNTKQSTKRLIIETQHERDRESLLITQIKYIASFNYILKFNMVGFFDEEKYNIKQEIDEQLSLEGRELISIINDEIKNILSFQYNPTNTNVTENLNLDTVEKIKKYVENLYK